jgi:hypothetical protein
VPQVLNFYFLTWRTVRQVGGVVPSDYGRRLEEQFCEEHLDLERAVLKTARDIEYMKKRRPCGEGKV